MVVDESWILEALVRFQLPRPITGSYAGWACHGLENRWTAKVVRVRFYYLPAKFYLVS